MDIINVSNVYVSVGIHIPCVLINKNDKDPKMEENGYYKCIILQVFRKRTDYPLKRK